MRLTAALRCSTIGLVFAATAACQTDRASAASATAAVADVINADTAFSVTYFSFTGGGTFPPCTDGSILTTSGYAVREISPGDSLTGFCVWRLTDKGARAGLQLTDSLSINVMYPSSRRVVTKIAEYVESPVEPGVVDVVVFYDDIPLEEFIPLSRDRRQRYTGLARARLVNTDGKLMVKRIEREGRAGYELYQMQRQNGEGS